MGGRFRGVPRGSKPGDEVGGRWCLYPLPPDLFVGGEGDIGEDRVVGDRPHRVGVGLERGAGGDAKIARFGVDRVEVPIGADVHPGDVVPYAFDFPSG